MTFATKDPNKERNKITRVTSEFGPGKLMSQENPNSKVSQSDEQSSDCLSNQANHHLGVVQEERHDSRDSIMDSNV